ncbi:class I SAM-dependent methyltransferase [Jiangella anatolica]|uniref:SAM-dependent methyltransferase n=1 Tax=Jiangella anatolica TaxID=2670374 RepID=A0A2W2AVN2_9ACTN|nr:class I SAM-dependent methyltransferase [Jiangella anatolica]PZF79275.1 SAM-dependent methyltransferase [Jiangella anatolica]
MSTACPACGSGDARSFYQCADVPVHSCLLVDDERTALDFPRGDLDLMFCTACGFVYNRVFDPAHNAYSSDYEETQGFSARFQDFIADLAGQWVDRYDLVGKTVVEIGCGKGEFLTEMVRAGAAHGIGVDPGVHPERIADDVVGRTTWIPGFFPRDYPELTADAVICRHTLEHIAPVADWMRTVRAAIGDRTDTVVLFELPDVRRVLEEGAFWDVYYEHCSYFSTGSLARLFRRTGFEVLNQWTAYDDQYLIVEARPSTTPAPGTPEAVEGDLDAVGRAADRFAAAHAAMMDRWRERLRHVADGGGRSVIWGSGSKGVAFLAALGADSALVDAAVDINPFKHGRYMAGSGHRIVAPKELQELRPDLVIAMNSAYLDEIGRDLATMDVATTLEAV